MQLRCSVLVIVSLLATLPSSAQRTLPPKTLVPKDVLATVRVENPRTLQSLALSEVGTPQPNWLLAAVAGVVGLPALDGIDLDHPWFAFAVTTEGSPGPWLVLPIADRSAFDASVVGMAESVGVIVEAGHALMGARPLPAVGGELPSRRSDGLVEVQARTGSLYELFGDSLQTSAVRAELERERVQARELNQEYQPPFDWSDIRKRVLPQHQTLFGVLEQSELATLMLDSDSETVQFQFEIAFDPDSAMGKLVALQKPSRPSELEALSDRSFYRVWMDFRLSESAETLLPYLETFAEMMGFSGEHFKQLVLGDAQTLIGVSSRQDRVVTESIYRPRSRTVEEHRRLATRLYSEPLSMEPAGIHRIYENEIARTGDLPVDRLVEYVGVDPSRAASPVSESYFAWGDDKLYSAVVVGEETGDAFAYLTELVRRSPGRVPDELRPGLAGAPKDLVFLSWFDLEAWDRAQVGGLIPPMSVESDDPAVLVHATTEGATVRIGGTMDVAQLNALDERRRQIEEAARGFFARGQALLYGKDVAEDPVAARVWYEKAAALGHAEAKYAMGYIYASGLGVEQSDDDALAWYVKAGAGGNVKALLSAGHIFYYGRGREVDYGAALAMYQAAALTGDKDGQFNVGLMFEYGRGVDKDVTAARQWYSDAAEQQHVGAQKKLGWMYRWGHGGVEKDFDTSVRWYRAAAEQGDSEAMRVLGHMFSTYGNYPETVTVDLRQSAEWYQRATDAGDLEATYELASIYYFGYGVDRDDERAAELYYRLRDNAPERFRGEVFFRLGRAYQFGRYVDKDIEEAARWMLASAEEGYTFGQAAIGAFYFYGTGVQKNDQEAVRWFRLSADEEPESSLSLGFAYETGRGVDQSFEEALVWYRKGAEAGHAPSQWTLGDRYERGLWGGHDPDEAAAWYRRAADQGYPMGQYSLGRMYLMGSGVPQDLVESYVWLSLAERSTPDESMQEEARALQDSLVGRLSPNELERARQRIEAFSPQREARH